MPCPNCQATITVAGADAGWQRREVSTIFEHPDGPRRSDDRRPSGDRRRPEDRRRPPAADQQPGANQPRPKRVFRDVTTLGRPTANAGRQPADDATPSNTAQSNTSQAKPDQSRQTPSRLSPASSHDLGADQPTSGDDSLRTRLQNIDPNRLTAPAKKPQDPADNHRQALADALDRDLLAIAEDAADAVEPDDEPRRRDDPRHDKTPDDKTPDDNTPTVAINPDEPVDSDNSTPPDPSAPPPVSPPTPLNSPTAISQPTATDERHAADDNPPGRPDDPSGGRADELARSPAPDQAPASAIDQGPWPVRVEQRVYDPVDEQALARLLTTGVWLDVIELRGANGAWIPLRRHPAYPSVRERLTRQTQSVVEQVTTDQWARAAGSPDAAQTAAQTAGAAEVDTPGETPVQTPRYPTWLYVLMALLVGVLAAIFIVRQSDHRADKPPADNAATPNAATQNAGQPAGPAPILDHRPASESNPGQLHKTLRRARRNVHNAAAKHTFARGLIDAGKPRLARKTALDAMVSQGLTEPLKSAFNAAIAADPNLPPKLVTVGSDVHIGAIRALGGGRSISLRMTRAAQNLYAFKPAQDEWGDGWRAEVASYVFCEIVPCHFDVPRNRPARISRRQFDELYGRIDGPWQTSYADRFDAIHWVDRPGPDGQPRQYVYGTLKDWVPDFVDWPIEYTQVWEPWLDARFHPANLDQTYRAAIADFKDLGDGRFYQPLLTNQGDADLRDVARQLSSILVFDYLTQNWDRFSKAEKYFGVNNQYADGQFISLDNGSAFYDEAIDEVGPRLDKTSRFSHSMITAIRALDPDTVNAVLFPDASWHDTRRLQLFWRQRGALLERVDRLIGRFGRRRVYEFR